MKYLTFPISGDWVFSPNMDSLGCQPFKWVNWALVLGLYLRDVIKDLLLVLSRFGLRYWVYAPIISNTIKYYSTLRLKKIYSILSKKKQTNST